MLAFEHTKKRQEEVKLKNQHSIQRAKEIDSKNQELIRKVIILKQQAREDSEKRIQEEKERLSRERAQLRQKKALDYYNKYERANTTLEKRIDQIDTAHKQKLKKSENFINDFQTQQIK